MIPPTSIDGTDLTGATIDGTDVQEITVDGDVVFSAGPTLPTIGLLHNYDATLLTNPNTFIDQQGSADLTANSSPILNTSGINGLQTVSLDGNDDSYFGALTASQPLDVFWVGSAISSDGGLFSTDQSGAHPRLSRQFGNVTDLDLGSNIRVNQAPTTPEIYLAQIDGSNSAIYISSKSPAGGPTIGGTDTFGGTFFLGANFAANNFNLEAEIGQVLFYDSSASGYSQSDVWDFLSAKWGITI